MYVKYYTQTQCGSNLLQTKDLSPFTCSFVDKDECGLGDDCCTQLCNNKPGGYSCGCRPGFVLNHDGCVCDGKLLKGYHFLIGLFNVLGYPLASCKVEYFRTLHILLIYVMFMQSGMIHEHTKKPK